MSDLEKYIKDFLKRPIFIEQEAEIVAAMIDGKINKNTARELYTWVMEENIKAHNKLMAMSQEEIMKLVGEE